MKRIIMKPGTYPRVWHKSSQNLLKIKTANMRSSLDKLEEEDAQSG
jgi:hypothetical protein